MIYWVDIQSDNELIADFEIPEPLQIGDFVDVDEYFCKVVARTLIRRDDGTWEWAFSAVVEKEV